MSISERFSAPGHVHVPLERSEKPVDAGNTADSELCVWFDEARFRLV